MVSMITPPIIISSEGDLSIYLSIEDAESSLEADIIKEEPNITYDAAGRLLMLSTAIQQQPILWGLFKTSIEVVAITPAEEEPTHEGELRSALMSYLKATGKDESLDNTSTKELIQKAIERISALDRGLIKWLTSIRSKVS